MTKDKTIHQVRNLCKTNIVVERKEGIFGRQSYSLVINENGQTYKILQACYKGGFWNSGCYKIISQINNATSIIQENNIIDEPNLNDNSNSNNKNNNGNNNNNNNASNLLEMEDILIKTNNNNDNEIELEQCCPRLLSLSQIRQQKELSKKPLPSKTFDVFKKFKKRKIGVKNECKNICIGNIESSGLFFDTTIIRDDKGDSKGFVMYESTSRTGELMKLKIALPQVHREPIANIAAIIANTANIPNDLGLLIAGFVGNVCWTKSLKNLKLNNCNKLFKEQPETLLKYHNKMPSWNPAIAAYTLEFCGRAILPSVHNFQMTDDDDNVVLQLGKVNDHSFNMDFGYPLSIFQAFAICLSVVSRTFVWD